MHKRLFSVAALFLLVTAGQAFGGILWFTDFDSGTNAIPGAITLAGRTGTQASSISNFNTLLSSGTWELVIFGEQGNNVFSQVSVNLTNYVNGGGLLIGATWQGANGYTALMQASLVDQDALTITTSGSPIFNGLGGTISLTNPGWGVYSQSYSPTGGATGLGTLGGGSAVIRGNNGRTLLNGPLFDTYANLSQGQQFIANEIGFLEGTSSVPEPGTITLLGGGLMALVALRRRLHNHS